MIIFRIFLHPKNIMLNKKDIVSFKSKLINNHIKQKGC